MNRNLEVHYSEVPYIDKPRSIFDRSHGVKTSGNVADLIPLDWQLVLPGDTWQITSSKVIRLQTLLTPIFDNLYADIYHFFVPYYLIFNKTREFLGENTTSAWVQQTQYRIPAISAPSGGFNVGSIADYLGLPVGVNWSNQDRNAPSALPFRAYAMIADSYFRDENLTDPLNIPLGDADQTGTNGTSYINDVANGGAPFKVAKYHDRFTSCLPSPQKASSPVSFSAINVPGYIPVYPTENIIDPKIIQDKKYRALITNGTAAGDWENGYPTGSTNAYAIGKRASGSSPYPFVWTGLAPSAVQNAMNQPVINNGIAQLEAGVVPLNLWADTGSFNNAITVNELRMAFQLQRYYEQLSRSGSRMQEYIKSFYGTNSTMAMLSKPEYLGGNRIPLNIDQVTNQSQSTTDFLGDLGAFSHTSDIHEDVEKSFSDFGILMTVMCIRYDHSYCQGIQRKWTRRDLLDQYVPTFAAIGEQPVYRYELYANGMMDSDSVFGYNEAWSDYRFAENIITGEMRPGISNSLASWHLGDYYQSAPTLSDSWIREDKNIVDRVLASGSTNNNQFFADIWFDTKVTRVMPMYSVPGLIDHF